MVGAAKNPPNDGLAINPKLRSINSQSQSELRVPKCRLRSILLLQQMRLQVKPGKCWLGDF